MPFLLYLLGPFDILLNRCQIRSNFWNMIIHLVSTFFVKVKNCFGRKLPFQTIEISNTISKFSCLFKSLVITQFRTGDLTCSLFGILSITFFDVDWSHLRHQQLNHQKSISLVLHYLICSQHFLVLSQTFFKGFSIRMSPMQMQRNLNKNIPSKCLTIHLIGIEVIVIEF